MFRESDRLNTFEKWPVRYINPNDLAAAGFYYHPNDIERLKTSSINPQVQLMINFFKFLIPTQNFVNESTVVIDRVQCFSCGMQVTGWEYGDEPFSEHKKWSPSCRFLRLMERMCNK